MDTKKEKKISKENIYNNDETKEAEWVEYVNRVMIRGKNGKILGKYGKTEDYMSRIFNIISEESTKIDIDKKKEEIKIKNDRIKRHNDVSNFYY